MLDKFNITGIILDHFKTLTRADTRAVCVSDYLMLFVLPLLLALVTVDGGFSLNAELANTLITALSILIGLLLNLLVVIYDILDRDKPTSLGVAKLKNTVLSQTFTNISFCILISLLSILLMVLPMLINFRRVLDFIPIEYLNYLILIYRIAVVTVIYSSGMHLFMILKRVYRLFQFNNLMKNGS